VEIYPSENQHKQWSSSSLFTWYAWCCTLCIKFCKLEINNNNNNNKMGRYHNARIKAKKILKIIIIIIFKWVGTMCKNQNNKIVWVICWESSESKSNWSFAELWCLCFGSWTLCTWSQHDPHYNLSSRHVALKVFRQTTTDFLVYDQIDINWYSSWFASPLRGSTISGWALGCWIIILFFKKQNLTV
jgi:hypothetical protein